MKGIKHINHRIYFNHPFITSHTKILEEYAVKAGTIRYPIRLERTPGLTLDKSIADDRQGKLSEMCAAIYLHEIRKFPFQSPDFDVDDIKPWTTDLIYSDWYYHIKSTDWLNCPSYVFQQDKDPLTKHQPIEKLNPGHRGLLINCHREYNQIAFEVDFGVIPIGSLLEPLVKEQRGKKAIYESTLKKLLKIPSKTSIEAIRDKHETLIDDRIGMSKISTRYNPTNG